MSEYKLKPGKIGETVIGAYKNVEGKFTDAFWEKNEDPPSGYTLKSGQMATKATAVYRKIEDTVVGGYKKVEDAFVDAFLEKEEKGEKPAEQSPRHKHRSRDC